MQRTGRSAIRTIVYGGFALVALAVAASALGLDFLSSPFTTTVEDHSPPPILIEVRDLADFHAATSEWEVVVDQEHDVKYLPSFVAGERVQYVAIGTVDAVVDLGNINNHAIDFDRLANSVVITLPTPTLADPQIDHERSHVMNRDRGLFNRVGGVFSDNPTSESDLLRAAEAKMADAAAQSELVARAEDNTRAMLTSMLLSMGIEDVEIVFEAPRT
jgi:hypothetical protein